MARRVLGVVFTLLVVGLLVNLARHVDWEEAWRSLSTLPASTLLAGAALAAASHLLYAGYDLIGRHQTGHQLPAWRVAWVGFISYAFNLNLGALVGGVAFRYKLYTQLGLKAETVTRVWVLSLLTNWLGYFVLAGVVLLWATPSLPPTWAVSATALPGLGVTLLLVAVAYLVLCGLRAGVSWQWRGKSLRLPPLRVALLQLMMSCANWMLLAGICWVLLQQQVAYPLVLGTLLLAAVAGVLTHVPAGLGVLEAVFVTMLAPMVPAAQVLGALLAYRAMYYLAPLALASLLLLIAPARRASEST